MSARQRTTSYEAKELPISPRETKRATIRALKKEAKRGNDEARRVLAHLGVKHGKFR
jgi:hypothetical protein